LASAHERDKWLHGAASIPSGRMKMAKVAAGDLANRASDMARLVTWRNGEKEWSPFSEQEMRGRQDRVRHYMAEHRIDACLFTSYHNICYLSGFLYCYFGR